MQNVMMNQLPELTIPLNRVIAPTKPNASLLKPKRNPYITKWRCLFDTDIERTWMCFEPVCGRIAYPCYACKDMFEDRNSFLDHVNRRGFMLKFTCLPCKRQYTFYNPCSFLLHARDHFNDVGGCIDLDHVSITTISMDIAGLLPIASIPVIYETADSTVSYNLNLCSKFFKPVLSCFGKRFVYFKHGEVLFFPPKNRGDEQPLVLMQVNRFIPMCQFFPGIQITNNVTRTHQKNSDTNSETSTHSDDNDIICLDDDDLAVETSPTKIQVKQMNSLVNPPLKKPQVQPCPECGVKPNFLLRDHFQADCKPSDDNNKCKKCGLISSSMCSLSAHLRYHEKRFPFICPECGKEYKDWPLLSRHVEDVCFHLAKTVKWKCPAKKCGKVFAQSLTFNAHFPVAHIKLRFGCKNCSEYFATEIEYDQHLRKHKDVAPNVPHRNVHECMVCFVGINDVKSHTLSHIQDKENRTYVFICKFCRSHYRSTQTYAAHLLRCTKLLLNSQVKKEIEQIETHREMKCNVIKYCRPCKSKIQITCLYKDIKNIATACPQCGTTFETRQKLIPQPILYESTDNAFVRKDTESEHFECVLCLRVLTQPEQANYEIHDCKYKYPAVVITTPNFSIENYTIRSIHTTTTPPAEDSSKRKRKRTSNHSSPKKRNSIAELTVNPVQFNGEYQCQLCDFKTTVREQFHEHIQIHRDVSTSYQCMECGECFVVKPSFLKHLQVMHSIEDVESYLQENECFDKEAMKLLEESMRMVPGEATEPCEENQCRICRQMFPDTAELSKHFRTHGMAFLMKKIIK